MFDKKLMRLAKGNQIYIIAQVLTNWISMLVNVGIIFALTDFLADWLAGNASASGLYRTLGAVVLGLLLRLILAKFASRFSFQASQGIKGMLRRALYEKILQLDLGYMKDVSTSEVVQVATEGIDQLEIYFGKYLPQLFYSLLAPLTLFVIIFPLHWGVALALLLCVPLIPISIVAVQKFAKKLLSKYWTSYTNLGDSFLENIQGLTTLKIYEADEYKQQEMNEQAEQFRKVTMKVLMMQLNSITVMDIVAYGGSVLGIILALMAHLSLRDTLIIILLSSEFFIPLRLLGSYFHIAMNGMAASKKMFRILELPLPEGGKQSVSQPISHIEASHLSFQYEEGQPVLRDIHLKAEAGQLIAFVGQSGCGKSTLAKLLLGKYMADQGTLKANGLNISDYQRSEWLDQMVYLGHDDYIFQGSVKEALEMADPNASEAKMWEVLEKVNLASFLKTQDGLETHLSERGANLSGGQRQRLCFARALLKDADIYILDEATSNIDTKSEEVIMRVVEELAQKKMIFLISHRLAIVTKADCIYYMENGQVLEKGSHASLMQQQGHYAHLYHTQYDLEHYMRKEEMA